MPINTKLTSLVPASERLKKTITLISGGYSLHPEVKDGQLTIYPWDSEVSEWVASSSRAQDPLFSATLVQKLTRLPSQVMDRFIASELLLVMLVARSLVTKGTVEYRARCPHCQAVQKTSTLKVPEELGVLGKKDTWYQGFDMIKLPESEDEIKLRPLMVVHLKEIEGRRPPNLSESGANLAASIQEVNGGAPTSPEELFSYYLALPPGDVVYLRQKSNELSPALDTVVAHVCDSSRCEKKFSYNLGLHYDFFL